MSKNEVTTSLISSLLILTKNSAVVAAASYFLTITLANVLGPYQFGLYSEALIYAALISIIITYATDQTAPKNFAVHGNLSNSLSSIIFLRVTMFCISGIAAYFFLQEDLLLLTFIFLLAIANFNLAFFYEIQKKNERHSYIYLTERIFYIVGAFTLIYLELIELEYIFILYGFVTLLSLLFQGYDSHAFYSINLRMQAKPAIRLLSDNFPLVIIALSLFAYGGLSRLVMDAKLGREVLGIYSAGWQLITIASMFQYQLTRVWRLRLSAALVARDLSSFKEHIKTYLIFGVIPICLAGAALGFWAEWTVSFIFTKEYASLALVLPTFGLYFMVIAMMGLLDICWIAMEKNFLFMIINIVFSLFLLIALWFFSDEFGILAFVNLTVGMHLSLMLVLSIIWYLKFYNLLSD
tara:strand:- start:287 stop:1513 length:1227 start_codon:yes stop_codon:yes gene_type:complete